MHNLQLRALRSIAFVLCALPLTLGTISVAQSTPKPPPLVPDFLRRIRAAHTVYLANGGADTEYASDMIGGADGPYTYLQTALQSWGRFQLVPSPEHADLIFTISASQPLVDAGTDKHGNEVYARDDFFHLVIADPVTHDPLWSTTAPAGWAGSLKAGQKAFVRSIANLTNQVKKLVAEPPAPS